MTSDSELRPFLDAERAADAARTLAHRREQGRYAGVAWSGLAPDPYCVRDAAQLAGDAAARLRERLAQRGLLAVPEPAGSSRARPSRSAVAAARKSAGRGTALSTVVSDGRR